MKKILFIIIILLSTLVSLAKPIDTIVKDKVTYYFNGDNTLDSVYCNMYNFTSLDDINTTLESYFNYLELILPEELFFTYTMNITVSVQLIGDDSSDKYILLDHSIKTLNEKFLSRCIVNTIINN